MSSISASLHTPNPSRLRSLVLPREHGAWGLLLVPLGTGAWVGRPTQESIVYVILFAVAALGLFCARTPLEAVLGLSPLHPQNATERRAALTTLYAYSSLSGIALAILFSRAHANGLVLLGTAAAAAFLAQIVMKNLGRATRMNAQLIGAIALTSTAAGGYYLASGKLDSTAWVIWAINWLFAANQIHYVQLRIHSARAVTLTEKFLRGRSFLIGEAVTLLLLALAWRSGRLPVAALVAFAPILLRGTLWFFQPPRPLEVRRLGLTELFHALAFGVLLVVGFQIPGI